MVQKKIQDAAAILFIIATFVLGIIAILGVWEVFEVDVIQRAFMTLGVLTFAVVVVAVATYMFDRANTGGGVPIMPNPIFKTIRHATLTLLIVAAVVMAFLGILSIWDVIEDPTVLSRSLVSLVISIFMAFIVAVTAYAREKMPEKSNHAGKIGAGVAIALFILAYVVLMGVLL